MNVSIFIMKEGDGKNLQRLLSSLEENDLSNISEIFYSGLKDDISNSEFSREIIPLGIESSNKAFLKNLAVEKSKGDYVLWLSSNSVLEDTTIEEMMEVLEENNFSPDIVYPNEVVIQEGEEIIRNFEDLYEKEFLLLHTLSVEDNLPEFSVLLKKETIKNLGGFDEEFEDFDFYKFIYENIGNIKLKQSDLSFVEYHITEDFIDTSYRSKAIRETINKYDWQTQIFPYLSWKENEKSSLATAYTFIGDRLVRYHDFLNASEFYRKALMTFHNKISLLSLINAYTNMGMFDNAKALLSKEQGLTEEEIKSISERIENIEKLVQSLENSVKNGKTGEVLVASNDIIQFYQGAPIYNLFGVIYYLMGELETAFKFFYKATIINPLEEDILRNLIDVSKQIGKEDTVKKLINRIVPQTEKVAKE